MYGKNFWERIKLHHICAFINHETEGGQLEDGTFEERYSRYIGDYFEGIREFRDAVIKKNWEDIKRDKMDMETEDLHIRLTGAQCKLDDLTFEVGVMVGLKLAHELKLQ